MPTSSGGLTSQPTSGHSSVGGTSGASSAQLGGTMGIGGWSASLGGRGSAHTGGSAPTGGNAPTGGAAHSGGRAPTGGSAPIGGTRSCGSLIDDMEDASGFICRGEGRQGAWFAFAPDGGLDWPAITAPGKPIATSRISGSRSSSNIGMHTSGDASPYAGIGFDLNNDGSTFGSYDASAFDGIVFWARGSADSLHVRFGFGTHSGTCTFADLDNDGNCPTHFHEITPIDDWWQYWVPFASLDVYDGTALRRDQLTRISFKAVEQFDFWLDDISFFTGAPGCCTPLPPGCDPDLTGMDAALKSALTTAAGKPKHCEDVCYQERLHVSMSTGYPASLEGVQCAVSLTDILVSKSHISDLKPLRNATRATSLNLTENDIQDVSLLESLENLRIVELSNNRLNDISPLTRLPHLKVAFLDHNEIEDVSALGPGRELKALDLSSNRISNISGLGPLTHLTSLGLVDNNISRLDALSGLTSLEMLWAGGNPLKSIDSLSTLTGLRYLDLSSTGIESLEALRPLRNLREVDLSNNAIRDLSPLTQSGIGTLFVSNNEITDLEPLAPLSTLNQLIASGNEITDASGLESHPHLSCLDLSNNRISNLESLAHTSVEFLFMADNQISKLDPLLTFEWVSQAQPWFTFDFSGNPIDCAEQAENIATLRSYSITLTVDCPP